MTANPKPLTEAARRAAIKHRRETSAFWMAVHILGSLNLAVILLITIAGAIAFATVMESKFNSDVARYYIYGAAWFNVWLLVLALNLLCAALTRWPWQRKHVGFVITHAGIILMLAGAVIGRINGFEAFVTLDKAKPPESRLFMHDMILSLDMPNGIRGQMPFDTAMHPPTEAKPFSLPLENSDLTLVIDRATENLTSDDTLAPSTDPGAPAGVALHFVNAGMGQNVPAIFMSTPDSSTFDFFGMAKVTLVDSLDEAHLIAPVSPTEASATAAPPRNDTPFHETQLVFAHSPQTPVIDTDRDIASGYSAVLSPVESRPGEFTVTVIGPNKTSKSWPLSDLQKKWESLQGDGDPVMFRVAKVWPDFAVKDGAPVSVSDQPHNPAILLQITGPTKLLPPPVPKSAQAAPPMPKGLAMRIAPAKEPGKIVYELEREGKIEARGVASQGDVIHLGWSKWEAKIDSVLPHAELLRDMKEFTGTVTPMMAESLRPGVRAHLISPKGIGPEVWIPAGTSRELFSTRDFSSEMVRVGYGQKVIPLPFSITLEKFEVPRDEGTETPANYISTLRFEEPSTGRTVQGVAEMNSPAMFPGDFWRSLLGWNYKFSQANWNPQNLNETTLQVLYDPGWPFKWVGSLGICIGIALMFYFMPKRSVAERGGREPEPVEKK